MRYAIALLVAFATTGLAAPSPDKVITVRAVTSDAAATATSLATCVAKTYTPQITATPIFTDLTCQISKALTPGQPLSCFFPTANALGAILGPVLTKALGTQVIEDIDVVAEDLCISAVQDPADGNGLCDNILQLVRDLAASQAQSTVDTYNCLLNLLCVARASPKHTGTCQYLLAGADCVANRILVVPGDPECD